MLSLRRWELNEPGQEAIRVLDGRQTFSLLDGRSH